MKKFLWNIFLKSGSIDAFLGFKEFEAAGKNAVKAAEDNSEELGYEK